MLGPMSVTAFHGPQTISISQKRKQRSSNLPEVTRLVGREAGTGNTACKTPESPRSLGSYSVRHFLWWPESSGHRAPALRAPGRAAVGDTYSAS